jgi:hypothetical protein
MYACYTILYFAFASKLNEHKCDLICIPDGKIALTSGQQVRGAEI